MIIQRIQLQPRKDEFLPIGVALKGPHLMLENQQAPFLCIGVTNQVMEITLELVNHQNAMLEGHLIQGPDLDQSQEKQSILKTASVKIIIKLEIKCLLENKTR